MNLDWIHDEDIADDGDDKLAEPVGVAVIDSCHYDSLVLECGSYSGLTTVTQ